MEYDTDKYSRILEILACPACKGPLTIQEERLVCGKCNTRFQGLGGFPVLLTEQPNPDILDNPSTYDEVHSIEEDASFYENSLKSLINGFLRPLLPGERYDTCVEIGSGTGLFTIPLIMSGMTGQFIYSDISPGMLEEIEKKIKRLGIDDSRAYPLVLDAESMPFAGETVDLILVFAVLHHLLWYEKFFQKCFSLLKKDGCLCFVEPAEGFIFVEYLVEIALQYNSKNNRYTRLRKRLSKLIGDYPHSYLNPHDVERLEEIRAHLRFIRENRENREILKQTGDKWFFNTEETVDLLKGTGFSSVKATRVDSGNALTSAWRGFLMDELKQYKVSEEGIQFVLNHAVEPLDKVTEGVLWKNYWSYGMFVAQK